MIFGEIDTLVMLFGLKYVQSFFVYLDALVYVLIVFCNVLLNDRVQVVVFIIRQRLSGSAFLLAILLLGNYLVREVDDFFFDLVLGLVFESYLELLLQLFDHQDAWFGKHVELLLEEMGV